MSRMGLYLSTVVLIISQMTSAGVIDVSNHGVVPGKDISYKLNQLIDSIKGKNDITLYFPKGTYEFYPENAKEMYRAVTNHDNSLKYISFVLHDFNGITIDGGGSTFIFQGRISPFSVEHSKNVTLKNLSIDWKRSFIDELPVVESNKEKNYIVVSVDSEKYPHIIQDGKMKSVKYNWTDDMSYNIIFDPKTRSPIFNTRDYSVNFRHHKASWVGNNRIKLEAQFRKSPPPVGSVLITYGVNPTTRLCPAIHLSSSEDIKIDNVTVYMAGGMGLIAERVENIHVNGMKVTSADGRMIGPRADATHFLGCKGQILVENSTFEHMLDDAINVHGAYVKVVEYLGGKKFFCEISHFQQWGLIFGEIGDKVAIMSRKNLLPQFNTAITDVRILNEHRMMVAVDEVPDKMPEGPLSMENLTWNPDLTFRNNIIRENRARGLLITTKGRALVENNYISSQMHGILVEGDNNKWYESGAVKDLVIRNNTFVNAGFGGTDYYPLFIGPLLTKEQQYGDGHYHSNIKFINNTLKSYNGHFVSAFSVDGLEIVGNVMEFSSDYPKVTDPPEVKLTYSKNVLIKDNKVSGFGRKLLIEHSPDCQNIKNNNAKYFNE